MLFMNNIEIAPHNIGKDGIHENVAGCLLAYGCKEGFRRGVENYKGYLLFDSKSDLIELYQKKVWSNLGNGSLHYGFTSKVKMIDENTG